MFGNWFRDVGIFEFREQVYDHLTYLFGLDCPAERYFSSYINWGEEEKHVCLSFYCDTFLGNFEVNGHLFEGGNHSYVLGLEPECDISFTTELNGFKFNFSSENLNVLSLSFRKSDYVVDLIESYGIQNVAIVKVSCGVFNGVFRIDMTVDW